MVTRDPVAQPHSKNEFEDYDALCGGEITWDDAMAVEEGKAGFLMQYQNRINTDLNRHL
jgi:hypothetical protein